ncbi:hypothetical protein WCX49_11810 [Sulfurimonas sp. HSL-1656]|uniref:hypothetical protein n=1 Tax=Thiomicrolovo subterrani TaxID=3131934 RepID=UPI0031F946D0
MMQQTLDEDTAQNNEDMFSAWASGKGISDEQISVMTHGELYRLRCEYNGFVVKGGGKFSQFIHASSKLPERMSRKEAARYYNAKLEPYWEECLDERVPKRFRGKAVTYLISRRAA